MNDDGDDVPANLPPLQNGRHRNNLEHNQKRLEKTEFPEGGGRGEKNGQWVESSPQGKEPR